MRQPPDDRDLRERVIVIEVEHRHLRDRLMALELARRYERDVPARKPFPWGTVVLAVLYVLYGIVNYLTAT